MSTSVSVKEALLVTPSEPTPTQVLKLSALDSQLFLRFTIEYLLVYEPQPQLDKPSTTALLKSSLAQILVPYYPLAGRVRARLEHSGLEVVCHDQGALFIEAICDATVSEFESAPKHNWRWRKLLSFHVSDVLKGAPPLVVQLTWLSDGGATLAVGFSHCLLDGIGSGEFLNSFAKLARGCTHGLTQLNPRPIWARHLLNPIPFLQNFSKGTQKRAPSNLFSNQNERTHPEFNRVPDICGFLSRFSREGLIPTSITFNKQALNKLKSSVIPMRYNSSSEFSCTSFEVLSAHIWRSWATSLNLPSKQIVKLLFSINIRNRVKPSLPSGYYGNAFVLGCAQTRVKDLIEKGLGHATELVKKAKAEVDDGYVSEVVESVSLESASPDSVGVLILSQWSKLGLDEIDFGMGKPVQVGPVCCDRYCLLLPVHAQNDAVKVNLAVPASAVDRYVHLLRSQNS